MSRKTNVLIVTRALSGHGGMETIIRTMLKLLNQSGTYDAKLFVINHVKREEDAGRWKQGLPVIEAHTSAPRFLMRWAFGRQLGKVINELDVSQVICADEYCVEVAARARKNRQKPLTVFSWLHFSLHDLKPSRRKMLLKADQHLAISSQIARQIEDMGVASDKVHVLFNCVARKTLVLGDNRFYYKVIHPATEEKPLEFLYIGRLLCQGQKRLEDMIRGLSEVNFPWRLHLVGNGEDEALSALTESLGIRENIIFHGWQNRPWDYLHEKLGRISCVLLTSAYEGLPMSLVEAVSYGIPCISSNCPSGPSDIIRQGKNGYLFEPCNVNDFVDQLNCFYTKGVEFSAEEIQKEAVCFYEEAYLTRLLDILNNNKTSGCC